MRRFLTAFAAFSILAASEAVAQTGLRTKLEPPDIERYRRWGPIRVRPLLEVEDVGYDDNIFSQSTEPEDDYTATVAPSIDGLVLLGSRAFLQFEERLEWVVFADNRDQSYLNQLGEGRLTFPFRRMGVFTDFRLDRVQERPQDREDLRRNRDTNGFGAGVLLLPGSRTEIELAGTWTTWSFEDEDADPRFPASALDRSEDGAALAARYDLNGRMWLTFDLAAESIEFDDPAEGRDSDERTTLGGLEFGDVSPLRGAARLGWTAIESADPGQPSFTEPVGTIAVSYQLNPRATLFVNARREAGFSASSDSAYFLIAEQELRFLTYLTHHIGVEAGAEVGSLTFPDARPDSDDFGRADDTRRYDVALRLRLRENSMGRRLEYRLRASRYHRDVTCERWANFPECPELDDIDRGTIGLGMVVGF
jgi:hypothetical protein